MDWLDKLNQWALKGVRQQAIVKIETNDEGITLIRPEESEFIRWSDVREIAVLRQPPLATGSFALAIRGADSIFAVVDEGAPGYGELCQEIPRRLKGALPYEQWAVELTASSSEAAKIIFRQPGS